MDKKQQNNCFSRIDKPLGINLNVVLSIYIFVAHIFAFYNFYLQFAKKIPLTIIMFEIIYGYAGGLGITVGCHRYWSHKTFKATTPLRILLMIMQTMAFQVPIYHWSRWHRLHHKFTDTNADPHNSKRGFWFSHIGWLLLPPHPDLQKQLDTYVLKDLENDVIVRFQSRWYWSLLSIFHFFIPISIIYFVWNIPLLHCVSSNFQIHVVALHITFCVNSVAHIWGDKPYNQNLSAAENKFVSLFAVGEGWHNYHHVFPMDYKTSEFGLKLNLSALVIDGFAAIGWAYDRKTISKEMLEKRKSGMYVYNGSKDDKTL